MRVIVHFELGHVRILDDLQTSVYRKLKKEEQLHDFERAILKLVKQMDHAPDNKAKQLLWQNLLVDLDEIGKKYGVTRIVGLEEITCWAESRLFKKPYLEVLAEKQKK